MLPTWNQLHRLAKDDRDRAHGRAPRVHHTVSAFEVFGSVDLTALDLAWQATQRDYSVILSAFYRSSGEWVWDVRGRKAPGRLEQVRRLDGVLLEAALDIVVTRPFDLAVDPLARLVSVESGGRKALALVVEHLVSDAWSLEVLFARLVEHYESRCSEVAPPSLIAQEFSVFSLVDHRVLSGREMALFDGVAELALPAVGKTPPWEAGLTSADQYMSARLEMDCPETHTADARLMLISGRAGLVHMAAQAALLEVLEQPPPATMLTLAARYSRSAHHSVGWYVNKVPVRLPRTCSEASSTASFLDRLGDALEYRMIPWARVVHERYPKEFGRHARFPYVAFNAFSQRVTSWGDRCARIGGARLVPLTISVGFYDSAITISVDETGDGISAAITCDTSVIAASSVADLVEATRLGLKKFSVSSSLAA